MKSQSKSEKLKDKLLARWSDEDYPGGTPRFQLALLAKDVAIFFLIPVSAIIFYKLVESSFSEPRKNSVRRQVTTKDDRAEKHSQIIQFQPNNQGKGSGALFSKRAPGTLVRVRLMNIVETFGNAPVHAQIIDSGLGKELVGATIIGDASPETSINRIKIDFKFVRHPSRPDIAVPISARAISLNGTYALAAAKKEGMFARAAIRSGANSNANLDGGKGDQDFRTLVAHAVAAGVMQEFQSEASVAHNNAQVLMLPPMTEFFVELTDYFPGQK